MTKMEWPTAVMAVLSLRRRAMRWYYKDGLVYRDPGAAAYDAQHRQRVIRRLRQRAANLGLARQSQTR